MPKPRRASPTEVRLRSALHQTAAWLADDTAARFETEPGRKAIDSALDVLEYVTDALRKCQMLAGDAHAHPIGFDAHGSLESADTSWDEPSHGLDEDHDHGADRPGELE